MEDRGTIKTSTIMIASGRRLRVYRRLEHVPPSLRRKLLNSTSSPNAGTVLIADRRGAQELLRANARLAAEKNAPEPRQRSPFAALLSEDIRQLVEFSRAHWRGLGVAAAVAAAVASLAVWLRF